MGNQGSRPVDGETETEDVPRAKKGRRATKKISKITLFVVIGSSALFEVKRTQQALQEDDVAPTCNHQHQSDIQISIRQLPIAGNPVAEGINTSSRLCREFSLGVMTTDDLASIKLHKARRNSIHSFSLNFARERVCSKSLDFESPGGSDEEGASPVATDLPTRVVVGFEIEDDRVQLSLNCEAEAVCALSSHEAVEDTDGDSDCSDSSSFALQISKLAASAIESENETVEKWGEKLARAIESKIGQPTSVVIKKSSRGKKKAKKSKRSPTSATDL